MKEAYDLIKDDVSFSDKERWVFMQLSEIKGEKTDAELALICRQRRSFMYKFVAKLREKNLYPIPIKQIDEKPAIISHTLVDDVHGAPLPLSAQKIVSPAVKVPQCEGCGLEGRVSRSGMPVMHGIELFREGGRTLCATCRLKSINPVHGTASEDDGGWDED